ncbi:TetR/AcrR family transcriptional regulator [Actinoallomurus sp. NPDC050550]|uniref:TetR/AcrR family transcriptional regulator n=1 Tax=Actinoallomurus sp. NPDC050550 TaxID=3154937 RepID=UPI0033DABAD2
MDGLSPGGRRLLDVAAEVFYAEGIRATGVDTLVERAGVSKPTLYAQFGSKENLVAAVLDQRRRRRQEVLTSFLAQSDAQGVDRILAVFDWLAQGHGREGFRGCPFTNAAVELPDPAHPARTVIASYKDWLRETLTSLARQAGAPDPEELGFALLMLIDGANARVVVAGDRTAMRRARAAAARLMGRFDDHDTEPATERRTI